MTYSVESLKDGIQRKRRTIEVLKEAIQKEKVEIAEYEHMIKALEEKPVVNGEIVVDDDH